MVIRWQVAVSSRVPASMVRTWLLLLLAALLLPATASGQCTINMRWDDDPPYTFFVPESEPGLRGIDIDLAREAFRRIGCELTFTKLPWARALKELEAGRIDLISGAFPVPEREKYAWFSASEYLAFPNVLFIRVGEHQNWGFNSLEEMIGSGFRLGVQVHVSYSREYDQLLNRPDFQNLLTVMSKRQSLWRMLALGRIDGVLANQFTGRYEALQLGVADRIEQSSLVVANKPAFFAFSKKTTSEAFVRRFNATMDAMFRDGTYDEIVRDFVGEAR